MPEVDVGWLLLGCVASVGGALALVRERWRAWWFELEDPRPMALYRIVFTFFLVCNVNGLWEHFELLFTSEGLFTGAQARELFSNDSWSAPQSLLYHWDSRAAFWIHLALFECCALLFMIGAWTRASGVLTLVLMESLFVRNHVFWEGTELVFRVFLVYLVCSRCGEAYSVDRWRRRRGAAGPQEYRAIPAWPRRLVILQMAALLVSTGLLKNGTEWLAGNAAYYMLSHDHMPRVPMGAALEWLGTGFMRLATWIARSIEVLYPLVLVGVIGRWSRARFPPLTGARRLGVRACLLAFLTSSTAIVALTGAPAIVPTDSPRVAAAAWSILWSCVWLAWRIGRRHPRVLDWCFGRRIWGLAAVALMLALWTLVNIGQFHTGMLASFVPLLSGRETGTVVHGLARAARRIGLPVPVDAIAPEPGAGGLAYSRVGRALMSAVLAWHVFAVAVELVPATDATSRVREPVRRATAPWLRATRTLQSWGMWAPNPLREVRLLRVVIVDQDGEFWDMRTDVYASERNPVPWIFYDRFRKIARRLSDRRAADHYQLAYARWHCREWTRTHDGVAPRTVELRAMTRRIPPPALERADRRREDPGFGRDALLLAHECAPED